MNDTVPHNEEAKPFARLSADVEHPLWLLQKEDTPSLVASFILSGVAHAALFALLAATRVFHPFAGASTQFELLWLSLSPASETEERQTVSEPAPASPVRTTHRSPEKPSSHPEPEKMAQQIPRHPDQSVKQPAKTPQIIEETPSEATEVKDTETALLISRYRGKVLDIVEKKEEIPTFKFFSSVAMKSEGVKAKVRTVSENLPVAPPPPATIKTGEREPPKNAEETSKQGKPPAVAAAAAPFKSVHGHLSSSTTTAQAATGTPSAENKAHGALHTASSASTGTAPSSGKPTALEPGSAGNPNPGAPPPAASAGKPSGGEAGTGATAPAGPAAGAGASTRPGPEALQPSAPKVEASEAKPLPPTPSKPRSLLHPPVMGDLKLVITGEGEVGVETTFREFRKARRDRPMTRKEWLRTRQVMPRMVRTKENVNEAVLETTEEGIYELFVKSSDGRPVKATFVLRIHESAPGAKTSNLGARTVAEKAAIAKVLMPEGIIWDDDSSFTGNMEDSESVTKFQAETGLVWKEYK